MLVRLADLLGVRVDNHAVDGHQRACGLQLWRFLDFHEAHAARCLKRKPRVVAKRRHFRPDAPRRFNDQRALRHLHFAVVNLQLDEFQVWHGSLLRSLFLPAFAETFYLAPTSAPADL